MDVGDTIKIAFRAELVPATIIQVEKYNGCYIIGYRVHKNNKIAIATVIPDAPYLPSITTNPVYYQPPHMWLYWKDKIWPVPVGAPSPNGSRMIPDNWDPIDYSKRKIDYVLSLVKQYLSGDMVINPGTEKEYELWRRWWPK